MTLFLRPGRGDSFIYARVWAAVPQIKKARIVRLAGFGEFHSLTGVGEGFFACCLEVQGGSFCDGGEFLLDPVNLAGEVGGV